MEVNEADTRAKLIDPAIMGKSPENHGEIVIFQSPAVGPVERAPEGLEKSKTTG